MDGQCVPQHLKRPTFARRTPAPPLVPKLAHNTTAHNTTAPLCLNGKNCESKRDASPEMKRPTPRRVTTFGLLRGLPSDSKEPEDPTIVSDPTNASLPERKGVSFFMEKEATPVTAPSPPWVRRPIDAEAFFGLDRGRSLEMDAADEEDEVAAAAPAPRRRERHPSRHELARAEEASATQEVAELASYLLDGDELLTDGDEALISAPVPELSEAADMAAMRAAMVAALAEINESVDLGESAVDVSDDAHAVDDALPSTSQWLACADDIDDDAPRKGSRKRPPLAPLTVPKDGECARGEAACALETGRALLMAPVELTLPDAATLALAWQRGAAAYERIRMHSRCGRVSLLKALRSREIDDIPEGSFEKSRFSTLSSVGSLRSERADTLSLSGSSVLSALSTSFASSSSSVDACGEANDAHDAQQPDSAGSAKRIKASLSAFRAARRAVGVGA